VVASVADLAAAATAEVAARIAGSTAEKSVPTDSFAVSDLTDHLEEGFYSIDLNWRITAVNRIAAQFLGKTREELLGRSIFEAYPRFAGSQVHAAHQRALSTNRPVRIESPAAGFESPLSIRIIPSPVGVAVFFHEISDLGRIREALRERDEALTLAEQSAGIGIWDSDPSTGLVRGTPQFFRLIGFEPSPEPVPIEIIRSVRHPEDQHRVLEGFRKAVESGAKTYDSEYRIIRRTDGELRWIFGRGLVTRDAAGKPIRYSGIDIDITERKKAEAALRESEERFRSLVQGVREYAIFMLDGDGQVTTWNEGAALIFGYSAEEILGKPLGFSIPLNVQTRAGQDWRSAEPVPAGVRKTKAGDCARMGPGSGPTSSSPRCVRNPDGSRASPQSPGPDQGPGSGRGAQKQRRTAAPVPGSSRDRHLGLGHRLGRNRLVRAELCPARHESRIRRTQLCAVAECHSPRRSRPRECRYRPGHRHRRPIPSRLSSGL
jgi:PAS domain S-box-containing protein